MDVLISATNAFCKYLKIDLERLPSPDGKKVGTQSIRTTQDCIAWQVHAVKRYCTDGYLMWDVIAVEARSRYTMLFSNPGIEDLKGFIDRFLQCWAEQCVHMAIECGAVTETSTRDMFDQFLGTSMKLMFFKNTDLSVNGHVTDAEQWLLQAYDRYDIDIMNEEEAFGLGRQINQFRKKAKPYPGARNKESFLPMSRMVDDWLYRFAKGLSEWEYPETKSGDFPSPFLSRWMTPTKLSLSDNVVNLDEARRKKQRV
ncbi:MAG: hypothetical protein B0D91_11295 [Oceanospirillales bacterium LUC14_002_19_P2]|nr:MAG: hypothetical protein B0D91_11295 [Oceanospirillales bacterium LUC14_002_19_P2]